MKAYTRRQLEMHQAAKSVAVLIIVIALIIAFVAWQRNTMQPEQVSNVINPAQLSYPIPNRAVGNVQIFNRTLLGAKCEFEGVFACSEAAVETLFADNADTGIARWERWVYMKVTNTATVRAEGNLDLLVGDSRCFALGGSDKNLNLAPSETMLFEFLCLRVDDPNAFVGNLDATFISDGRLIKVRGLVAV